MVNILEKVHESFSKKVFYKSSIVVSIVVLFRCKPSLHGPKFELYLHLELVEMERPEVL